MIPPESKAAMFAGEVLGVIISKSYDISRGVRHIAHHEFFCKSQEGVTEVADAVDFYANKAEWGRGSMKPLFEMDKRPGSGDPSITVVQVLIASHAIYFELWHKAFLLDAPARQALLGILLGYGVHQVNDFVNTANLPKRVHISRKPPEIW